MNTKHNIKKGGQRLLIAAIMFIGIISNSMASTINSEDKLSKEEATTLIKGVKADLEISEDLGLDFIVDDEGNIVPAPIKIIKIYDKNNELLLEAPIHKLDQLRNEKLRRLINASDFLTQYSNTKYYRLDL